MLCLGTWRDDRGATMRVRRDVAGLTLGDPAKAGTEAWDPVLDTYARGVRLMKDLDLHGPPVPESWMWAANTHGIEETTSPRPAWAQCAHHSLFFLPWHRAYLAWFEATIRRLTGEDDWALPYWDYSSPTSDRLLPPELTVRTRTVDGQPQDNPLFSPDRSPDPIPVRDVDVAFALGRLRFVMQMERGFGGVLPDRFDGAVELLPHNFVHGDIGGDLGLMRSPATAAQDPVFWLHHANIDRLWEMWLSLEGSVRLTDPGAAPAALVTQWRSATFWFGDEGSPTTYPMDVVEDLSSAQMDYSYESVDVPDAVREAREAALTAGGGLSLDESEPEWEPVGATFDLPSGEDRDLRFDGGALGLDEAAPSRLMLELAGVTATDPHAAYVVEVRSTPDGDAHTAGRFSTFGLAGTPVDEVRNYLVERPRCCPTFSRRAGRAAG